tara:strand:- start:413 stop:562 length:150 start_codon:yes stop_codon:yes gene_type:complete
MAESVGNLFWMRFVSKVVLMAALRVIHHYITGTQQHGDWPICIRVRHPD